MADAVLALGLSLAALCCAAGSGAGMSATLGPGSTATLCRDAPLAEAAGRRPVLVTRATDGLADAQAGSDSATAVVTGQIAVEADTGETTLLGLFPGIQSGEADQERRFLLPGGAETRCWTIRLDGEGRAGVALGHSDPMTDQPLP